MIDVSIGYTNELSNDLYTIELECIRGGNWVAIKRKEAVDLLKSLNAHKFTNFVNSLVVVLNY
jgi:hypothetical protein